MAREREKQEFIRLRAQGLTYAKISKALGISKSTCTQWTKELNRDIATFRGKELNALYDAYSMSKEAKIKRLGETLKAIEGALDEIDYAEIQPEKLLEYKLKYIEALQKEYIGLERPYKLGKTLTNSKLLEAYTSLLDGARKGNISEQQLDQELKVLNSYLKALDTIEIKQKLDDLEKLVMEKKEERGQA